VFDRPPKPGDVGSGNQVWFDSGTKVVSTWQTSLVKQAQPLTLLQE
jgi:hypothetical protein